jgi:glucan biosynthesis protein C
MLLGVVVHTALSFQESPPDQIWPFRDPERSPLAGPLVVAIHIFRMPVFFVMAGFFAAMLQQRRGSGRFIKNRFFRIAVPFVIGWFILFPLVKLAFVFAIYHTGIPNIADAFSGAANAILKDGLFSDPSPIHLWFLYYLLMLYVAALLLTWIGRLLPTMIRRCWNRLLSLLAVGPWRLPILVVVTFLLLLPMQAPSADTPMNFDPQLRILVFYGFFLLVGWAMWNHRSVITQLHRWAWLRLLLGCGAVLITTVLIIAWYITKYESEAATNVVAILLYVSQGAVALSIWLVILGGIGVAERIMRRHHPVIRYLVDASYWIYLVHLPLCVFMPSLLSGWKINGTVKMLAIMVLVTIVLLLSYQALMGVLPARRRNAPRLAP